MSRFRERVMGHFGARKTLVSLIVATILVVSSAIAVVAMSGKPADAALTITSVSHNPEEGYVNQSVEWTAVVEVEEQGQQGKGLLFTWNWDDGTFTVYHMKSTGTNSTFMNTQTHMWSEPGKYRVVISVWDGFEPERNPLHNVSAKTWFVVTPPAVNTPPVAAFDVEPEEGTVDTVFAFDATASSDLEGPSEALEVRWDWESDDVWDTDFSHDKNAEHMFEVPGVYTVSLEVIDSGGMTATAMQNVSVLESPVILPHAPIHIDGDLEFINTAASESWAGDGTEADPFVIELYEFAVNHTLGSAIRIENTTMHFIIRGCEFSQVTFGIHLYGVANASVYDNLLWSCYYYSIYFEESENLSILNNTVIGGTHCIGVIRCNNAFIEGNTVSYAEWYSLCMHDSSNVILRGNSFDGAGIWIRGSLLSHWNTHYIDYSNMVKGRPACYFKDCDGGTTPSEAGQIILANCKNMTVSSYAPGGISLGFSSENHILQSYVFSARTGISLSFSPNTTIESVNISDCSNGLDISDSPDCVIDSAAISWCHYGMWIRQSDRPTILNNSVRYSGWCGIYLQYSSSGQVKYNQIVDASEIGLVLVRANSNLIASNDFIGNSVQALEHYTSTGNVWNDEYPTGGNYWSDYVGIDLYSGPNQNKPGSDGIGDTPYVLASGSLDNYPLMEPSSGPPGPSNEAPVAIFTVSVDGATIAVDASASYDPDGTIVSYDWDWGDSTTGTGKTATHTYVPPSPVMASAPSPILGVPPNPYIIVGYTTDVEGNPMPDCTVTITNVNKSLSAVTFSDSSGIYQYNLASMSEPYYDDGDEILVEAVNGTFTGSAVGYVDKSSFYTWINVTLEPELPPGQIEVTITLTVTDDGNLTDTAEQVVTVYFTPAAPVAAFTVFVNGLTISVDASASWDLEDPVEELEVRWDWEADGVWDTTYSETKTAQHVYSTPGTYTVILEVIDSDGLKGWALQNVSVSESPGPTEHEPIWINGNGDFTYENGVVGGSGTLQDPYVISGWEIESTTTHCIRVVGTTLPFVIKDCFIHGEIGVPDNYYSGICNIYLEGCQHASVQNVIATHNDIGVRIENGWNTSITNTNVSTNWYGLFAKYSSQLTVTDVDACYCKQDCMYIGSTNEFVVQESRIMSSRSTGMTIYNSNNGYLQSNVFDSNGVFGLLLLDSGSNIALYNNTMFSDGVYLLNCGMDCWTNIVIDGSNTVNGLPILHYTDVSHLTLDGVDAGQIILGGCQDVTITGLTMMDSDIGILAGFTNGCSVTDSAFSSMDGYAACFVSCADVDVSECNISGNEHGIAATYCSDVKIRDSEISSSDGSIALRQCNQGEISGNTVGDSNIGIYLFGSSSFSIVENVIVDCDSIGINFDDAHDCLIYHNDFYGLAILAQDCGWNNTWDNGYPNGGNYWSDYTGDDANGDGIGDTPRPVPPEGTDRYPLMEPVGEPLPSPYTLRDPIFISGDDDFTEENGVVSGNGTWSAPYLIEGWEIDLSEEDGGAGIRIEHTTAIFFIRDCYIHDGIQETKLLTGISLTDNDHATVEFVIVERCSSGLFAYQCDRLSVANSLFEDNLGGLMTYELTGGSSIYNCQVINEIEDPVAGMGGLGISVSGCTNISVARCSIEGQKYVGVIIADSDEVSVNRNTIRDCGHDAIRLQENITDCWVWGNDIADCGNGTVLWLTMYWYSPDGIVFYPCDWYQMDRIDISQNEISNCSGSAIMCHVITEQELPITNLTVRNNDISGCGEAGILLRKSNSADIYGNDLSYNGRGVCLYSCANSVVWNNNIVANSLQAYDDGGNAWDGGYAAGGNHWSDYTGVDENGDGIGDSPYAIAGGSQDNYPLMMPC